jgi:T5SS/PEP-CTERM-associated repeat protein
VSIGRYGIGDFTITNATAWFTNTSVGRHDGATGTLTVQDKASLFCVDDLSIGRFANSIGHVYVPGGLLSLTNDNIWTGREGTGDLNVSGGTVRAKALYVGMSEDGTNTPQGTATLTGGATILSSNLIVGTSLLSTGQVNVAGGLLVVTNQTANNAIRIASGNFSLSQGVVIADTLLLTNATGAFTFAGGELRAGSITVSNGAPFVVGNGVQPATLKLGGGTYSFADGLTISSNATVTGCGTILGPISNNGTLSTNCGGGIVIGSVNKAGATATIFFSTASGASHVLEFKTGPSDPVWSAILPGIIGNGSIMSLQDTTATNAARFYRIHIQ